MYWEEKAAASEQQQGQNEEGEKKIPEGHHGRVEKQVGLSRWVFFLLPAACV